MMVSMHICMKNCNTKRAYMYMYTHTLTHTMGTLRPVICYDHKKRMESTFWNGALYCALFLINAHMCVSGCRWARKCLTWGRKLISQRARKPANMYSKFSWLQHHFTLFIVTKYKIARSLKWNRGKISTGSSTNTEVMPPCVAKWIFYAHHIMCSTWNNMLGCGGKVGWE